MARVGMNPAKLKQSSYRPARVTAAVMVHIPNFVGYFEHRFQVLQTCLHSIRANTDVPFDLMVLDNASAPEVQDYLRDQLRQGQIQFLLHSEKNLGKLGGLEILFQSAPGEIVAYSDDDFYFLPGWLEAQLAVLDGYPDVGMVSGYVIPSFFSEGRVSSTIEFAKENQEVKMKIGRFIPDRWIEDWAISTGREPESALLASGDLQETILEYRGIEAFAAANHDQFLAPKRVIQKALPGEWSGRLMGGMIELDERINQAGYLRLSTRERTTQHLGNQLSSSLTSELPGIDGRSMRHQLPRRGLNPLAKRFVQWAPVRAIILGLYSRLFRLVHPE